MLVEDALRLPRFAACGCGAQRPHICGALIAKVQPDALRRACRIGLPARQCNLLPLESAATSIGNQRRHPSIAQQVHLRDREFR